MRVLGVHVQIAGGRYKTHFAVVADGELMDQATKTAPAGNDEPRQLEELEAFTEQMLGEHDIELVSLRQIESAGRPRATSQLETSFHAEGAVLVAVGRRGLAHSTIARATMGSLAANDGNMAAAEAVDMLCSRLGGVTVTADCAIAAAVALTAELQAEEN